MIRTTLLWLFISCLSILAIKDWYKGVCTLILLIAILEHPDMPHAMLGIPGLNPWNVLFIVTICSWLFHKQQEGLHWDMPRGINILLILQLLLFTIGFLRIFFDKTGLEELRILHGDGNHFVTGTINLWIEDFFDTIKWVVPGLLLFHGCNSRSRLTMALFALLAMYLLLSLLVYKAIPPWKIIDVDSLTKYSLKLNQRVGYHRVDLSAMLAGASWAFFSAIILVRKGWQRAGLFMAGGMVILSQALTGGRAGYIAWCLMGLFFGLFRWRKLLIFIPLVVFLLITFIPQIRERVLVGLDSSKTTSTSTSGNEIDVDTLTAGREGIWHLTLEQFWKAPLTGHGRLAILRTGVAREAIKELGESFGHPHNAYLEQLVDNGILGLIIVLLFYLSIIRKSFSLLKNKDDPTYVAVGGIAMALILTQLIASLTAQSFYPRQGVVGMWCSIGLMLRVFVEKEKIKNRVQRARFWLTPERGKNALAP